MVAFEVTSRQAPAFEGRSFGSVGAYEKVVGRAKLAIRPDDPHNAGWPSVQGDNVAYNDWDFATGTAPLPITIEADNAPPTATVEVSVGTDSSDGFAADP